MRNTNEATTDIPVASPVQQDDYTGDVRAIRITLAQARPGLFMFNGTLHLKTEYKTDKGEIEAYVGASGEFFWGGVDNYPDRAKLIVCEVDADAVAAALHSPAVAAALEKSAPDIDPSAALARIAELEAEVARLQDADALNKTITSFNTQYYAEITKLYDRIAELEAEVVRLQEALRLKYGDTLRTAVLAEREALVECIRSTTWSGTEEIVAMIRARSAP